MLDFGLKWHAEAPTAAGSQPCRAHERRLLPGESMFYYILYYIIL